MESKLTFTQEKSISKGEYPKSHAKTLSSETDSCISDNFDSAADCSYKSGEISATHITLSGQLSNLSISDSGLEQTKTDQNLIFDSGLEADCTSPITESGDLLSEESLIPLKLPRLNEKLQWQDFFLRDKDGDT